MTARPWFRMHAEAVDDEAVAGIDVNNRANAPSAMESRFMLLPLRCPRESLAARRIAERREAARALRYSAASRRNARLRSRAN